MIPNNLPIYFEDVFGTIIVWCVHIRGLKTFPMYSFHRYIHSISPSILMVLCGSNSDPVVKNSFNNPISNFFRFKHKSLRLLSRCILIVCKIWFKYIDMENILEFVQWRKFILCMLLFQFALWWVMTQYILAPIESISLMSGILTITRPPTLNSRKCCFRSTYFVYHFCSQYSF